MPQLMARIGARVALVRPLLLLLAGLACRQAAADEQRLAEWAVTGPNLPAEARFYRSEAAGAGAEAVADPHEVYPDGTGAIAVRIAGGGRAASDIQLYFVAQQVLGKGGRYRVSWWAKASAKTSFSAGVIRDDPPWSALGAGSSAEIEADPTWRRHELAFSPGQEVGPDEAVRAPDLALGRVPAGTTIWIAGVALWEVEPPPPLLPILLSGELLQNAGFEAGLQGWSAQAGELAAVAGGADSPTACRVTRRTARWGTPVQDLRTVLGAHGMGLYEFGARVRPVEGRGEALAVIHLRDAAGDHWFTTDTRKTAATSFTRVSAQRLLTWAGRLEAAELGVQTTGDDTADILVDDLSLRTLTDLARGRPCTSSGDAAGHSAALAVDGDQATTWQAAGAGAWLEVDLGGPVSFNTCMLSESGSAIQAFELEVWDAGRWRTFFAGGEVLAPADELHFAPTTGSRVRWRLLRAAGAPALRALALYATAARDITVRVAAPPVDARQRGERTLVGAIRWDGWCGDRSPVGVELERVMAPERYHFRLPFYARIEGPGKVAARCTTQEVMDREIAYAKEASIDYWAFDWYPPGDGLATARSLYLASRHRDDVKWCAILCTGAFADTDRRWLTEQFKATNYQTVLGGRPLVYLFNAQRQYAGLVKALRDECAAAGVPTPFVVCMGWGPGVAEVAIVCGADALGAYVNPTGGGGEFAANLAHERRQWEALRQTGRQVVPTITTGWDTRPFHDCPVPWYPGATADNWVQTAQPAQVAEQLREALAFNALHPEATLANSVLVYAWNENAEGGWLVPTLFELRDAGYPQRLDAVRSVLRPAVPRGSGWAAIGR